ncbi:hypothetical protein MKW92_024732, partial [Papaver armeniacum]
MLQPFYRKGINSGREEDSVLGNVEEVGALVDGSGDTITSVTKRNDVYKMTVFEESFKEPEACGIWRNREEVDRNIPFQEKHVLQQNPTKLGSLCHLNMLTRDLAVVEFGAGRGYLTQTLADCYGIKKILLVERNSYRLKDRSLRQKESLILERLRIDIEDLDLNAVESLKGSLTLQLGNICVGLQQVMQLLYTYKWMTRWICELVNDGSN